MPNQSDKFNYNPNLDQLNRIEKLILCVILTSYSTGPMTQSSQPMVAKLTVRGRFLQEFRARRRAALLPPLQIQKMYVFYG